MENAVTSNGGGARPPRLPRWTRQEILVLIQGKKVAESRGRGRLGSSRLQQMGSSSSDGGVEGLPVVGRGASTVEPKWASVSSYCSRRGVNRGPVQCRKRWSNLAGDYKKIKEWELKKRSEAASEGGDDEKESFWVMRNDLRRERKLPGFFDREVFDILDGKEVELPLVKEGVGRGGGNSKEDSSGAVGGGGAAEREIAVVEEEDEDKEEAAAVFDSGRTTADDGLFTDSDSDSDSDDKGKDDGRSSPLPTPSGVPVAVTPISERKFDPSFGSGSDKDRGKEKTPEREGRPMGGRKRQREGGVIEETRGEKEGILQQQLVDILDRNSRMMTEQLEVQNVNCRLDREQRADMARSVVEVLGKLAEAIGKIAEKL